MMADDQTPQTEARSQTWCEVCDVDGEPLTLAAFSDLNPDPFPVCSGCVDAWEQMIEDDPTTPTLLARGA